MIKNPDGSNKKETQMESKAFKSHGSNKKETQMERKSFKSLNEAAYNVIAGIKDDTSWAEEMVLEYLDNAFGDMLSENVNDDSIEDALFIAIELAEAIEIVLSERQFGKPARTASDLAKKASSGDYSYDQGTSRKEVNRGKKVRDAAVKRATTKYGKVVGAAVKARAARSTHDAEYDSTGRSRRKMDKLDKFIARRTGGK